MERIKQQLKEISSVIEKNKEHAAIGFQRFRAFKDDLFKAMHAMKMTKLSRRSKSTSR
ncbi:MAG: hypothetical protein Q6373_012395 [Candidatus Sigynarchaeota archaeon]